MNLDTISCIFKLICPDSMFSFRLVCKKWYEVSNTKLMLGTLIDKYQIKVNSENEFTFPYIYIGLYPTFKSSLYNSYHTCIKLMLDNEVYNEKLLRYYIVTFSFMTSEINPIETLLVAIRYKDINLLRDILSGLCVIRNTPIANFINDNIIEEAIMSNYQSIIEYIINIIRNDKNKLISCYLYASKYNCSYSLEEIGQ